MIRFLTSIKTNRIGRFFITLLIYLFASPLYLVYCLFWGKPKKQDPDVHHDLRVQIQDFQTLKPTGVLGLDLVFWFILMNAILCLGFFFRGRDINADNAIVVLFSSIVMTIGYYRAYSEMP